MHRVLDHYKEVRQILREKFDSYPFHPESRVAICGSTEFAELVYLGLKEFSVDEIDFFNLGDESGRKLLGMPVREISLLEVQAYDWIIVAQLGDSEKLRSDLLKRGAEAEHIIIFFQDSFVDSENQRIDNVA